MDERIRHIDGLRGVAVLSVVLFHAGLYNSAVTSAPQTPLLFLLRQGSHGVDLFFVLSGFCLAYPTLARLRANTRAKFRLAGYATRRLVRILPPYYAAIAVFTFAGAALLGAHSALPAAMDRGALSFGGVTCQALFLDGNRQFIDQSFWTLAIEFRWYFAFPVLLWLWIRAPKSFAALAVAAFIATGTRMKSADALFMPVFMLGIVAAELHVRAIRMPRWSFAALAAALAVAVVSTHDGGWSYMARGPYWGVAMFCFVAIAGSTPWLRRILAAKWLVALGSVSYGVYLIHEPVVALVERSMVPRAGGAAGFALAVSAALAAGVSFSVLAERPFVDSRLRDRIIVAAEPAITKLLRMLGMPADVAFSRPAEEPAREVQALAG